jgi:hypothetical protein
MRRRPFSSAISATAVSLALIGASACASKLTPAPPAQDHRTIAEGYSLLYAVASQQKDTDKLLLVKAESDSVDVLINEIADYMKQLSTELEDFSKRYPALTIEQQFLPEVEVKARDSITEETTKTLLSLSGREFERYLLFKQRSALDAEHHISKVMIDLETNEERRSFWIRTEKRIGELRVKVDRLLARDYYR